jgi:hypothetical protein
MYICTLEFFQVSCSDKPTYVIMKYEYVNKYPTIYKLILQALLYSSGDNRLMADIIRLTFAPRERRPGTAHQSITLAITIFL